MFWILTAILVIVFFANFSFVSAVVLTVLLFLLRMERNSKASDAENKKEDAELQTGPEKELADLALLHLELTRLHQKEKLDPSRYSQLSREISFRYAHLCGRRRTGEDARREQMAAAWSLLEKYTSQALGPPPWQPLSEEITSITHTVPQRAAPQSIPAARTITPAAAKPALQTREPTAPTALKTVAATASPPAPEKPQPAPSPAQPLSAKAALHEKTGALEQSVPQKAAPQHIEAHRTISPAVAKPAAQAPEPTVQPTQKKVSASDPPPKISAVHPQGQLSSARAAMPEKTSPGPIQSVPLSAGKPEQPSALEQFMSSWVKQIYSRTPSRAFIYQIMVPFFLQNIGWFIAGICGVSGSIYLVAATTGYWKALAVVISLIGYTGILFGGGYLLRRKRPELITSSGVLLALGVLLVPLNLAACVRLTAAAAANALFLSLAAGISLAVLGGFAIAVRVASGIIDRSLTDEHPRLFMALAALQFAVPFLGPDVHWLWAAALHFSLLCVLAYALQRFTGHWLHSIFIGKRKIAYYAAGTLVYAALVSFVHLTKGAGMDLPEGYAGPFLMVLSGLLFYVDIQFKQWVRQYAPLSRFTFVVYALSVLALLISAKSSSLFGGSAKSYLLSMPFSLSLAIGVLLYGGMVWKYLTLPPLYLLLACFSTFYAQSVLQFFPGHWHFFLALPGLHAIIGLHRFAQRRESAALALVTHRAIMGLIPALVVWSLFHSPFPPEGIISMLTPLAAAGLVLHIMGLTPVRVLRSDTGISSRRTYMLTGLAALTLAYAPLLAGSWHEQFSGGLIALAFLWTGWGLHGLRRPILCSSEALFNSTLLNLAAGILFLVAVPPTARHGFANLAAEPALPFLLTAAGGVLLWLSLGLRVRTLFYGAMMSGGAGIGLLKARYFPLSSGKGFLFAALLIWALLWHLQRRLSLRAAIEEAAACPPEKEQTAAILKEDAPVMLIGLFPVQRNSCLTRTRMVVPPLQQAFYLLWLAALWKIVPGITLPQPDFSWAFLAILSALTTLLAAGGTRIQRAAAAPGAEAAEQKSSFLSIRAVGLICLLPLAAVLLIKALLVLTPVSNLWQPCMGMGYALLIWLFSCRLHTAPWPRLVGILGWQGGYGDLGGSKLSEHILHWAAFALAFLCTGTAWSAAAAQSVMSFSAMKPPFEAFLAALVLVLLFLWLSGQRYALRLHSYLFIGCAGLGGFSLCSWLTGIPPAALLQVQYAAPILSLAAAGLALTAYALNTSADSLYCRPVQHSAFLVYLLALASGILLFWMSWTQGRMITMWLPWTFLLLTFGQILLLDSSSLLDMPRLRSTGTAVLLSIAFSSFLAGYAHLLPYGLMAWSFVLWMTGGYLLPQLNARFPRHSLPPAAWPVSGLILVLSTLSARALAAEVLLLSPDLPDWPLLIGATVYLLLMSHTVTWEWLPWLAGLGVTVSGLNVLSVFLLGTHSLFSLSFLISAAIWLNLVLRIMHALHAAGEPSDTRRRLDRAFFFWPSLFLCVVLALFTPFIAALSAIADSSNIGTWFHELKNPLTVFIVLSILLNVSFFHLVVVLARSSKKWRIFFAHLLLLSLTDTVLMLWLTAAADLLQLPLLFGLWAALLQTMIALFPSAVTEGQEPSIRGLLKETAWKWLPFLYAAALSALVFAKVSGGEQLLVLTLLSGLSISMGLLDRREDAPADMTGMRQWLSHAVPCLSYLWALLESLWLLRTGWTQGIPVWLPPVFVLLALGQIPLLHRLDAARTIRGVTMPLLLTIAFIGSVTLLPFAADFAFALIGWSFMLWAAGSHGFPRFNTRWPHCAVAPDFSLLLGLILLLGSVGTHAGMTWPLLAAATLYLFLMQRSAGWQWLAWPAAFSLTWMGALLLLDLFPLLPFKAAADGSLVSTMLHLLPGYPSVIYGFGLLIWLNLLLHTPIFLKGCVEQTRPLFVWPFLLFSGGLLGVSLLIVYAFLHDAGFVNVPVGADGRVMALGAALSLSFLHAFALRPRRLTAQCLLWSVQAALVLLFINCLGLPLLFSLSVVGLLLFPSHLRPQSSRLSDLYEKLSAAVRSWLPFNLSAALLCLVLMPNFAAGEHLLALLLLGGAGIALGLSDTQNGARLWQTVGVALLIIALHLHWMFWLPQAQLAALLPWYALQFTLLGWLAIWIQKTGLLLPSAKSEEETEAWLFTWLAPALSILAALEWLGHGLTFLTTIIAQANIDWEEIRLFGVWDNAAAIAAGMLLTGLWMQKIRNQNLLIYSLSAGILLLGAYIRLVWAGLTPCTVWDTSALMGAGYLLLILQRLVPSSSLPLYRVTLLLPVLALFTVPWQVGSVYAGSTLIAATAVFLLMQRNENQSLPVYLALLALNTGLYLWVPGLFQEYRLVQIYTVPVAITVLLMLQLHLLELKPSVLNAVRLSALSALYAGTALDVFLRPEFYVFALALGLSLVGIILGIALRVRAFLFTGVIFFVLNIAGQLVNFYPQDRLGKAILLMTAGGVIAGGMIWFSIQRETIMRQIRTIRADLAEWE